MVDMLDDDMILKVGRRIYKTGQLNQSILKKQKKSQPKKKLSVKSKSTAPQKECGFF